MTALGHGLLRLLIMIWITFAVVVTAPWLSRWRCRSFTCCESR
jgi:hypothetical protein